MTASVHGLTGMVIGALLPPYFAVPLAFISHFVYDSLPHYGISEKSRDKSRKYKTIVTFDTLFALSFAAISAYLNKWSMFWVGWVAYSPDFMWVYEYFTNNKKLYMKPRSAFAKFHKRIQKHEPPSGIYIEIAILLMLLPLVIHLLSK